MEKNTMQEAQTRLDEICSRKRALLVESAKRKIESAKLTVEAAELAEKFKEIDIKSMIRCW